MHLEMQLFKRLPRLFLAHDHSNFLTMSGVRAILPDRTDCRVMDISFSGVAIEARGVLSKMRVGAAVSVRLKFDNGVENQIQLRLVRLTSDMMGFAFESISPEGRLQIEQLHRDQLIKGNLQLFQTSHLHPLMRADAWVHGPFDTNFFFWKTDAGNLQKFILEYDHLILSFDAGKMKLSKSHSVVDPAKGYVGPLLDLVPSAVSVGSSWLDRLLSILDAGMGKYQEQLGVSKAVLQTISLQRDQ